MAATTRIRRVGAPLRGLAIGLRTQSWPAYSRLFVAGDGNAWAIADDAAEVAADRARPSASASGPSDWIARVRNQSVFHTSQFTLIGLPFERNGNRLGVAYLHGRPGYARHARVRHVLRDRAAPARGARPRAGLEPGDGGARARDRDRAREGLPDPDRRRHGAVPAAATRHAPPRRRRELGLPESAFVVGSFQKDGVGWGDGLEPKLIKGPDVLLDVAERLAREVPELRRPAHRACARVRRRRARAARRPVQHALLPDLDAVARAYRAIDLCLVTSRDEGGPKAVLESMATGVPLVTTRVGQAADLVRDGRERLAAATSRTPRGSPPRRRTSRGVPDAELEPVAAAARETAEACSWDALRPRWRELFRGFVAMEEREAG